MERLEKFLSVVTEARWRHVPAIWSAEFRAALSDDLVKVGWGGVIELTDAGRDRLSKNH